MGHYDCWNCGATMSDECCAKQYIEHINWKAEQIAEATAKSMLIDKYYQEKEKIKENIIHRYITLNPYKLYMLYFKEKNV